MEQQLTDIASLVFWSNVQKKDFSTITGLVLSAEFDNLWTIDDVPFFLAKLNLTIKQSDFESTIAWIYNKTNEIIYNATSKEENIIGTTYIEDTIDCRPPDFSDFEMLGYLQNIYSNYKYEKQDKLRVLGTLLLRTPLPSIVFTNNGDIPKTFVIENTQKALGFQANLIMEVDDVMRFPENPLGVKYCISGIIKIWNYNYSDIFWHKLIPNSICYNKLVMQQGINSEKSTIWKEDWQEFKKVIQEKKIIKLYHFTDSSNLASIKKNRGLYSWIYCELNDIQIIKPGGDDLSRKLDKKYNLQDYVRLSFNKNNPMLQIAKNEGRIQDPVFLEIDPEVIYLKDTQFSDMNATKTGHSQGDNLEYFMKINFEVVTKQRYLNISPDLQKFYQAEVMVKRFIPLEYITNINDF